MEVTAPVPRAVPTQTAALVPLLGLLWGFNWVAVRICLTEIPPWTLRAAGFAAGTLALYAYLRVRGKSLEVPRRHWLRLVVVGLLSITFYNLLSAFAQLSASTTRSSVLSYTMPIWAVIFARIVVGERVDRRRALGLGLGIAGLLSLGWPILAAGEFSIGLVWAILSGVSWAAGSVVLKRYPIDAGALTIAWWQLMLAVPVTTAGMLVFEGVPELRPLQTATIWAFIYHAILAQAVATTLWFTILEALPTGIASIGSLLVPAVGVLGATAFLGERPTTGDLLGLAFIVAASAVVLVRLPPERRT
ncbi:DMT family transporter [Enterovirga aerilata]|nr:DMT family transporter [Enterovirga sp. DB1703]